MPDNDPTEPDDDDQVYRWVIRSLYVAAVGLNIWMMWQQVKDSPEAGIAEKQVKGWIDKLMKPARDRKHFRKQANAVVFEAMQVVDRGQ